MKPLTTNIYTDQMQYAELFGRPVLHTRESIPRETVPEGWHCYDLCGTERRPHKPSAIMDHVIWGRVGTVLSPVPLKRPSTEVRQIKDTLILSGKMTDLSTFCREHDLPCPSDPRKFILRPASVKEAGFCKQSSKMGQISPQSIPVLGRGFARKYTSGKVS